MTNFETLCKGLEEKIQAAYTEGLTIADAEKLAGEFLGAMLAVSVELKAADLSSRMHKAGVKAVRAGVYLKTIQGVDKKPTEAAIAALVDTNEVVQSEQDAYDTAEVDKDNLERYYNIFREAHVWARGISRGKFD